MPVSSETGRVGPCANKGGLHSTYIVDAQPTILPTDAWKTYDRRPAVVMNCYRGYRPGRDEEKPADKRQAT